MEKIMGDLELKIPDCESGPHLLVSKVRKAYLQYMIELLAENYVSWCGEAPPSFLVGAAHHLELQAAGQAMVVPVYRKCMLKQIKSLKECTARNDLFPSFQDYCIMSQSCNKLTQTEELPELPSNAAHSTSTAQACQADSPEDMDCYFVENPKQVVYEIPDEPHPANIKVEQQYDNITKEMEELFQSEGEEDIESILRGNDQQAKIIIDQVKKSFRNDSIDSAEGSIRSQSLEERMSGAEREPAAEAAAAPRGAPVCSVWPCELHYMRQHLRAKLREMAQTNIWKHTKCKRKILVLFGSDSEDEEAEQPEDNSSELRRSCRQRAAPFLAKHLQAYLRKGRLTTHLYKPLFRHLLYRLVHHNQYPADFEIFFFVKKYFKKHPAIRHLSDF